MISKNKEHERRQFRLLYKLEAGLEAPMFILSILWLVFFVLELTRGLSQTQERLLVVIWIAFVLEFLLKLFLAPRKWEYIKKNWLTVIALIIPGFRTLRLLRAIRVLRVSQVASTTRFVRALTSTNRFVKEVKEAQGPKPTSEMNVGVMLAYSQPDNIEERDSFVAQLIGDVTSEMKAATGQEWLFHYAEPERLQSENPRQPADFLDSASLRMAEGPFDMVVVVTDVALMSRKRRVEPGLASPVCHVVVVSTRKLVATKRGNPTRSLASETVRWDSATLLLHLIGHLSGLPHKNMRESKVMAPFELRENRQGVPRFSKEERDILRQKSEHLPERELRGGTMLEGLIFHILMSLRHPKDLMRPLLRNWAFLLPLSLPGLATAAVAPSFLLVFTAEIWDVGINMQNQTAVMYALISVVAASLYLVRVQSLFLPRKEKRILTEHLAVANVVIFLSILLACIGLFFLVGALMYLIEVYIFPQGLMKTWPTLLDQPEINWEAKLRLAAFISTVGVTTGALAGGMESKTVIQHLALFQDEP